MKYFYNLQFIVLIQTLGLGITVLDTANGYYFLFRVSNCIMLNVVILKVKLSFCYMDSHLVGLVGIIKYLPYQKIFGKYTFFFIIIHGYISI